jgi:hypothetical protein
MKDVKMKVLPGMVTGEIINLMEVTGSSARVKKILRAYGWIQHVDPERLVEFDVRPWNQCTIFVVTAPFNLGNAAWRRR